MDPVMEEDFQGVIIRTYQMIEPIKDNIVSGREHHCPLTPHQNVALFRHPGMIDGRPCHAAVCHTQSLLEKMVECLFELNYFSEEYRKVMLLQVTHGLNHLHSSGIVHGHISPANIIFPTGTSCRNVVLSDIEYDGDNEVDQTTMRSDIIKLADVFEYVLKNGQTNREELQWRDAGIARRLLSEMRDWNRHYSTSDVLKHPFFWSDDKKINFLSRSVDILENKKKMPKLDERESFVDWIDLLSLSPYECDQCNRYLQEIGGLQQCCNKDAVKQRARKKHRDEKKTKLSELLKFFRNTKTHFCELVGPTSWAFKDDETSQYWRFFGKRYPQLFYHVFDVMTEHGLLNLKGVQEIYLETECENAPLPKNGNHKIQQELYEQDFRFPLPPI